MPPPPLTHLLRKIAPAPYLHPLFLIFKIPPPAPHPSWEVINIYHPLFSEL